ncbi:MULTISPECIES: DUF2254 domain-containing protein [Sphingobium]|jgi:uncharacterized membrane protein|uniref:DUF2254 domain-containing protein n=1 Tax=Sphingobium TaxID=165695 RepID=UPI000C3E63CA|nr:MULTISPECIES: DUF2254 domain-containing protein [Sphingobium]MEC9017870.1 DUF2254 domain-containing protein [Pseudomonadota bacterium]MAX16269.1 hypothetical protein [Sphingobium sp.]MBS48110.1 hypothetical protein [Sphingobium sp.]MBS90496.1 hypothetical protein [Sphingobium sp.]MCC4255415.1 DUF2254 domain-containing protein [Sphingobium lactosutens]|tara:strand:+ start:211 stop:1530 length:1320 start_codon:yes stop_codon:yes gene_type:complete
MIARLRALWQGTRASYWFYPALFTTSAALLAILTVWLDRHGAAQWLTSHEWVDEARPEGARNVLNVISGSMIGVASTVFSITIAAVVYASGSYGPRLLANFMEDRGNQLSLATFIATFVYSVLVLRVVRDAYETAGDPGFVPQLSLLIATGLMAASIVVLVYFLNHVPASIRINAVLEGIGERLLRSVRDRFPKECAAEQQDQPPQGAPVAATGTGYIQIIDFAGLDRIARDVECRIELRLRPGDFVHPDVVLLAVVGAKPDDAMADGLRDCFSLGAMRSPSQDIEFLIDELVEIALRALSPGINDPFTAVTALHWLGAATAQIGARDLRGGPDRGDYDWNRIVPMNDDFDHFVRRGFGGIRAAAATSPIAAAQFLDCLLGAGSTISLTGRRARLREEGALLMAQARLELAGPSLDEVEARYCDFLAAMKDGTHERLSS